MDTSGKGSTEMRSWATDTDAVAVADMTRSGVSVVQLSENRKLGCCAATYVSQKTCPVTCRFYHNGCYGEHGPVGVIGRRLDKQVAERGLTVGELEDVEARLIDSLIAPVPLRLHVLGDTGTNRGAKKLGAAARRYKRRTGETVFGYTHWWQEVLRSSWGPHVSILASCETLEEVREAWGRKYAASIVVRRYESKKLYTVGGVKVLPCPQQTTPGVTCYSCRLCFNDRRLLKEKIAIGFEVHGSKKNTVELPVLGGDG